MCFRRGVNGLGFSFLLELWDISFPISAQTFLGIFDELKGRAVRCEDLALLGDCPMAKRRVRVGI